MDLGNNPWERSTVAFQDDLYEFWSGNPRISYLASAANPFCRTPPSFAIAASAFAQVTTCHQSRWIHDGSETSRPLPDTSIVTAVDWLSKDVVVMGCSDRGVWLWDTRDRPQSREAQICHPSAINHTRRFSENTIAVAGRESWVMLFIARGFEFADISSFVPTIYALHQILPPLAK